MSYSLIGKWCKIKKGRGGEGGWKRFREVRTKVRAEEEEEEREMKKDGGRTASQPLFMVLI